MPKVLKLGRIAHLVMAVLGVGYVFALIFFVGGVVITHSRMMDVESGTGEPNLEEAQFEYVPYYLGGAVGAIGLSRLKGWLSRNWQAFNVVKGYVSEGSIIWLLLLAWFLTGGVHCVQEEVSGPFRECVGSFESSVTLSGYQVDLLRDLILYEVRCLGYIAGCVAVAVAVASVLDSSVSSRRWWVARSLPFGDAEASYGLGVLIILSLIGQFYYGISPPLQLCGFSVYCSYISSKRLGGRFLPSRRLSLVLIGSCAALVPVEGMISYLSWAPAVLLVIFVRREIARLEGCVIASERVSFLNARDFNSDAETKVFMEVSSWWTPQRMRVEKELGFLEQWTLLGRRIRERVQSLLLRLSADAGHSAVLAFFRRGVSKAPVVDAWRRSVAVASYIQRHRDLDLGELGWVASWRRFAEVVLASASVCLIGLSAKLTNVPRSVDVGLLFVVCVVVGVVIVCIWLMVIVLVTMFGLMGLEPWGSGFDAVAGLPVDLSAVYLSVLVQGATAIFMHFRVIWLHFGLLAVWGTLLLMLLPFVENPLSALAGILVGGLGLWLVVIVLGIWTFYLKVWRTKFYSNWVDAVFLYSLVMVLFLLPLPFQMVGGFLLAVTPLRRPFVVMMRRRSTEG